LLVFVVFALAAFALPARVRATDVDGPNDCTRNISDFGDAPEGSLAYPGVIGHFPSCLAPGAPGSREEACPTGLPAPGPTGYVQHISIPGEPNYWLGCGDVAAGPMGVDSEGDAKVNSDGTNTSYCNTTLTVDCFEIAFGLTFGQDECYGSTDAGIASAVTFTTCALSTVPFTTWNCGQGRTAYLNILVDWSHDGDWNDNVLCPGTPNGCVSEWAVKNAVIDLAAGCQSHVSPSFYAGPTAGPGWMRITISDQPVPDDFTWAGSANMPGGTLANGETEDYPVSVQTPPFQCPGYIDFGDAPEGIPAYPSGLIGHFPTCLQDTPPGTMEIDCSTASGSLPGPTGYVEHIVSATDPIKYWLGCGDGTAANPGVDSEIDGKVSLGGPTSACDERQPVDCIEPAWGGAMSFGQDECYGDLDAGIASPVSFAACSLSVVRFTAYNCTSESQPVYLNLLVDWNQDGDWNDNIACRIPRCVPEWALKNVIVTLPPGCNTLTTPSFIAGPSVGLCWMRITISEQPANADFPWAGTATMPNKSFSRGETEDYPVSVVPSLVGVETRVPGSLEFSPMTPNPASRGTEAVFALPRTSHVTLVAYDVGGRALKHLVDGYLPAGSQHAGWDFRDDAGHTLPAGIYLMRLTVEGHSLTRRVIHTP
jgi:hypothetical protein